MGIFWSLLTFNLEIYLFDVRFVLMEKEIIIAKKEYKNNVVYITPSELSIIEDMSHGMTSREIAEERKISLKTAEVHRYNILKKTGYKNSVHLIASFLRKGLIK